MIKDKNSIVEINDVENTNPIKENKSNNKKKKIIIISIIGAVLLAGVIISLVLLFSKNTDDDSSDTNNIVNKESIDDFIDNITLVGQTAMTKYLDENLNKESCYEISDLDDDLDLNTNGYKGYVRFDKEGNRYLAITNGNYSFEGDYNEIEEDNVFTTKLSSFTCLDKDVNTDSNLPSKVLGAKKTSGDVGHLEYVNHISKDVRYDSLAEMLFPKFLNGISLGIRGEYSDVFGNVSYHFENVDSNNPKLIQEYNSSTTQDHTFDLDSLKGVQGVFVLFYGGNDSAVGEMLIIEYGDKIVIYRDGYKDDEYTIDRNYSMFYIFQTEWITDGEEPSQMTGSYLVGTTEDGKMYLLDGDSKSYDVNDLILQDFDIYTKEGNTLIEPL